jgi:hypothetical protein
MHSFSAFPSTFQDLRLLEEVLYDLPPLEGVFLHWHTHGVTATTAGMHSLLARRKQVLGPTTLSGASIQLLYACATDSLRRLSLPWQDLLCPWKSRPLPLRCLRPLIRSYARRAYPWVRVIELESEDTLYAHTHQSIG